MVIRLSAALLAAAVSAGGASAAPVRFAGDGVVTFSTGTIPAMGTVAPGDPIRFSFTFDAENVAPLFVSADFAAYTLRFDEFSASLGDYAFTPDEATARVSVARGFSFFGQQPFSEPSRSFSFSFRGAAGPGAPFAGVGFEQFSLTATFRDPDSHFDLVRCGVAIYGLDPVQRDPAEQNLEPALELRTYLAEVKRDRRLAMFDLKQEAAERLARRVFCKAYADPAW